MYNVYYNYPLIVCLSCCGGSPIFLLVVHQTASPFIWPAEWGLSTNQGVTTWCVCGCS